MEIVQEFFTRKQIATMLGLHPMTIVKWEKAGKLTAYKLGDAVRYKREDVQRMIESSVRKHA